MGVALWFSCVNCESPDTGFISQTFWHSSAHVLGQALELEYGVDLTIGPSLEEGFYYDCYMGEHNLQNGDMPSIEKKMAAIVKEAQPFERVVVTREEALSMFQENKFKVAETLIQLFDSRLSWLQDYYLLNKLGCRF